MTKSFNDDVYGELTGLIGYLRHQQNLIQETKANCPKVADTQWLSLGRVCKWFYKQKNVIQDYLNKKDPACKPDRKR